MNNRSLVGQILGQYELQELLGRGGMAEVYLGYQPNLKRHVAVKVLNVHLVGEEGYVTRFIREAEIAASLEHPHIVPIIDFGTQAGINVNYVVMRLLRGGSLADRVRQRRAEGEEWLSLGEIADLLKQIAGALDYAHKRNIVHRDIKPSNIMFDNQGTAFLVDFGIAKPLDVAQQVTLPGTSMGTVAYMAPEQWRGEKLTPGVDQYAMGLIIYTLVTGKPPFDVPPDAPYALMHKHINEMPIPVHVIRPELPQTINEAIEICIAKRPEDRYPSVMAFAENFESAIQGVENKGRATGFFTFPLPSKPSIDALPRTPTPGYSSGQVAPTPSYAQPPSQRPPSNSATMPAYVAPTPERYVPSLGSESEERPARRGNQGLLFGLAGLAIVLVGIIALVLILNGNKPPDGLQATQAALNATQTAIVGLNLTATALVQGNTGVTAIAQVSLTASGLEETQDALKTTLTAAAGLTTTTGVPALTATETPGMVVIVHTATPTPNVEETERAAVLQTATMQAQQTNESMTAAAQMTSAFETIQAEMILGQTLTATNWTRTPTNTPTLTPTWTPTNTPTLTSTPSVTDTPTLTNTPSATDKPTLTSTPTASPTLIGGGTGRLFFASGSVENQLQIMQFDIVSGQLKQLTQGTYTNLAPAVSPDGTRIVFASDRTGNLELYIMDIDGSNQVPLTDNKAQNNSPSWSPDGQKIVFNSTLDGTWNIYSIGADGKNLVQLTHDTIESASASWSPDGSKIAFDSKRSGKYAVYVMNSDGTGVQQLVTFDGQSIRPSWAPDGRRLAFVAILPDGNNEIFTANIDGTNPTNLTNHPSYDLDSSWSPDGTGLAFWSVRGGNWELYLMNADGSNLRQITKLGTQFYFRHATWENVHRLTM